MSTSQHSPSCKWPLGEPCREFSTDGTRLGAAIAHQMGTTSEEEIIEIGLTNRLQDINLTGMDEEQADWEEGGDDDARA